MGLLDQELGGSLKGAVSSVAAAEAPALISAALAKTNMGNLQGLVGQLQQGGLGRAGQILAWQWRKPTSYARPNTKCVTTIKSKNLRSIFGVDPDAVAKLLADHLPTAVDQASSDGSIQGS